MRWRGSASGSQVLIPPLVGCVSDVRDRGGGSISQREEHRDPRVAQLLPGAPLSSCQSTSNSPVVRRTSPTAPRTTSTGSSRISILPRLGSPSLDRSNFTETGSAIALLHSVGPHLTGTSVMSSPSRRCLRCSPRRARSHVPAASFGRKRSVPRRLGQPLAAR